MTQDQQQQDKIAHRNKLNLTATTVGGVIVVAATLISALAIIGLALEIVIPGLAGAGVP